MKQNDKDAELREEWYLKIDNYIYWINRYSQRNQRKERQAKIHQLISDIQAYTAAQVAEARLTTTEEWHTKTLREAPYPSQISKTLHEQEDEIKRLKAHLTTAKEDV